MGTLELLSYLGFEGFLDHLPMTVNRLTEFTKNRKEKRHVTFAVLTGAVGLTAGLRSRESDMTWISEESSKISRVGGSGQSTTPWGGAGAEVFIRVHKMNSTTVSASIARLVSSWLTSSKEINEDLSNQNWKKNFSKYNYDLSLRLIRWACRPVGWQLRGHHNRVWQNNGCSSPDPCSAEACLRY